MTPDDITFNSRLAGLVKRYHTWPTITIQSNAEHSWQVYRIYCHIFGVPTQRTAYFMMMHDVGEIATGDLPYPTKSENYTLKSHIDRKEKEATEKMGLAVGEPDIGDRKRVQLCHMIEMWEFGLQEVCMGNKIADPIRQRCFDKIEDLEEEFDGETRHRIYEYMDKMVKSLA
jgi:hypothetical protein